MKNKTCILTLKYIPIICAFLMLLHVIVLSCGCTYCFAELSVLTLVSIMILLWSIIFKFCILHKLASAYTITVLWCCYIQRFIGFGKYLDITRLLFIDLGIILFMLLSIKYVEDYKRFITKSNK